MSLCITILQQTNAVVKLFTQGKTQMTQSMKEKAKLAERLSIKKLADILEQPYTLTEDDYDIADGYIANEPVEAKDRNPDYAGLIAVEGFLIDLKKLQGLANLSKKSYYVINIMSGICYAYKLKKNWKPEEIHFTNRSASQYYDGNKQSACVYLPIEDATMHFHIVKELKENSDV